MFWAASWCWNLPSRRPPRGSCGIGSRNPSTSGVSGTARRNRATAVNSCPSGDEAAGLTLVDDGTAECVAHRLNHEWLVGIALQAISPEIMGIATTGSTSCSARADLGVVDLGSVEIHEALERASYLPIAHSASHRRSTRPAAPSHSGPLRKVRRTHRRNACSPVVCPVEIPGDVRGGRPRDGRTAELLD